MDNIGSTFYKKRQEQYLPNEPAVNEGRRYYDKAKKKNNMTQTTTATT